MYESTYRTLKKFPWSRTFHGESGPRAKAGYCTVTGTCKRRADFSIYVRSAREECWLAACAQHVPPMAQGGGPGA
jgi:hypothetical protein